MDPFGRSLGLSAQEKIFMHALVEVAGSVVSRERMSQLFSPEDPDGFEVRRIDVLVSRLRSKAQAIGMKLPVVSVRGQGYVFTACQGRLVLGTDGRAFFQAMTAGAHDPVST